MEMALEEAELAGAEDEVPIGAVIVSFHHGVIGRAHNQRERLVDPTAHAEIIAITQPAQLPLVVYGAVNPKAGWCETLYRIPADPRLNHRAQVVGGVLADRCAALLTEFCAARHHEGKG